MTASIQAFVNLARRGMRMQQRNTTERLEMYQQMVRRWAVASNVGVIFAENSGADLSSIEAMVPAWRRERFEFMTVPKFKETLPPKCRPDVDRLEAQTIVHVINNSRVLATRCPNDIIFGITGRYFVHDFEHRIHNQCLDGKSGDDLPNVLVQNPTWGMNRGKGERETSALGFRASFALNVHGWAVMPVGQMTYKEYVMTAIGSEIHLGRLVKQMDRHPELKKGVCDLKPLPVHPVHEGSSGPKQIYLTILTATASNSKFTFDAPTASLTGRAPSTPTTWRRCSLCAQRTSCRSR